jgi:hypothetical protein
MRLTFFPLAVLAVLFVLAIPILLALISAAGVVMPWLFFGLVVWVVAGGGRGPRRQRWVHHGWQTQPIPAPRPHYPSVPRPPSQPVTPPRPELPIDVQVKVEQIRRKVDVLLGFASRFPPFSKDLYIVRQTASEYLPRTIDAYLALPPGAPNLVVADNGRTALHELKDQLDLLDLKLDEIAEDLQCKDLDRLLANRRFLEERFGRVNAASPPAIPHHF